MLAKRENLVQQYGRLDTQANWNSQVILNYIRKAKTLTNFCQMLKPGKNQKVLQNELSSNIKSCADIASREAKLSDFLETLVAFI